MQSCERRKSFQLEGGAESFRHKHFLSFFLSLLSYTFMCTQLCVSFSVHWFELTTDQWKKKNPISNHININSPHSLTHMVVFKVEKAKTKLFPGSLWKILITAFIYFVYTSSHRSFRSLLFKLFLNLYILKQIMLILDSLSLCAWSWAQVVCLCLCDCSSRFAVRERDGHVPHLALIPFCWVL